MRVDLLVVNAVNHNFLPIPQSTFPMLQSTIEMEFVIVLKRSGRLLLTSLKRLYTNYLIVKNEVIVLKRSGRLLLTSLRLSFKYLLFKRQK